MHIVESGHCPYRQPHPSCIYGALRVRDHIKMFKTGLHLKFSILATDSDDPHYEVRDVLDHYAGKLFITTCGQVAVALRL
jgi:hypothetical protein